ncbi:MAG: SurA N-terminal domain-containing protein [Gaiellaceae bacterium]
MPLCSLLAACAAAALLPAFATGCGSSAKTLPKDGIVLVGDQVISSAELATLMNETRSEYREQGIAFPRLSSAAYRTLQDQAVGSLIQSSELDQSARKMKLTVTPAQIKAEMNDLLKRSFDGDRDKLRAELVAKGLTQADLEKRARQFLIEDAIRARLTGTVMVSSSEVRGYYTAHTSRYASGEVATRRIRDILVRDRALAARLSSQIRRGASFVMLARKYSLTWHASVDGALTITRGGSPEGLEKAVFSLRTGQVSGPVRTALGWYVIQALAPTRKAGIEPLSRVESSIRSELLDGKQTRLLSDWLAKTHAAFCARGIVYRAGYKPVVDPCAAGTTAPPTRTA